MERITYTYFYTEPPFWAILKPDFKSLTDPLTFTSELSQIVIDKCENDFQIRIARDGLIEIRSKDIEESCKTDSIPDFEITTKLWKQYLSICNVFYMFLDSATLSIDRRYHFYFQEITIKDVSRISYENGRFSSSGLPLLSLGYNNLKLRYLSTYSAGIPIEDQYSNLSRYIINSTIINYAIDILFKILPDKDLLGDLHTLCKALSEYKIGNYETSIVLSWFIIESHLKDLFTEHILSLPDHEVRFKKERMEFIFGRDFTAGVISNVLEIIGLVSFEQLKTIDLVRKLRNDIAHKLGRKEATMDNCQKALNLAASFLMSDKVKDFMLNLSLQGPGL